MVGAAAGPEADRRVALQQLSEDLPAKLNYRLREMLLGGATRHVLENAAVTPILMAH